MGGHIADVASSPGPVKGKEPGHISKYVVSAVFGWSRQVTLLHDRLLHSLPCELSSLVPRLIKKGNKDTRLS